MRKRLTVGELQLGLEGLALLRLDGAFRGGEAPRRIAEIRKLMADLDDPHLAASRDDLELDVSNGYQLWSATYDMPGNFLVETEEPVVRGLLDQLPAGAKLDVACATGRHLAYLLGQGREVIGVGQSSAMLAVAHDKAPQADLRRGDCASLPVEDAQVVAVVCALALEHVQDVGPVVAEFGRVLRPGGRLITSTLHPIFTNVISWTAWFIDQTGRRAFVTTFPHCHSDYVAAASSGQLRVRQLLEPS
jgi:SAM-dependent methyltransferase